MKDELHSEQELQLNPAAKQPEQKERMDEWMDGWIEELIDEWID